MTKTKPISSLLYTVVLASSAVFAGVSNGAVAAERIACPATLNLGISNMPDGWRKTSKAIAYRSAKIIAERNQTILQCKYGQNVGISRVAPIDYRCQVAGRGFACFADQAQHSQPTPPVYKRGRVTFIINQSVDIDQGRTGPGRGADFRSGPIGMSALGTSRFSGFVASGNYKTCKSTRKNVRQVNYTDLVIGARFCMKTGAGRLSSMVVSHRAAGSVTLTYRTWR